MAGMVHANDVRIAEGLRDIELPADPAPAIVDVATRAQRRGRALAPGRGPRHPRSQRARSARRRRADGATASRTPSCLPMYSSASVVPLPSARTGGDADGDLVADAIPGGRGAGEADAARAVGGDDPRWPPIPAQDFSNLPRQQKGLHAKGFEYMRLSERAEGHISNFERTVDGFLAGLPYEKLLPALQCDQREPARDADRRHRLLMGTDTTLRRRRRGRPRHDRRVHARARRRPHRRRRRHLLPRRRGRHPRHGHPRRSRRAARRVRASGRRAGPSATSSSTRSSPTGATTRRRRSSDVVFLLQGDAGWAVAGRRPLRRHPALRRRHLALPPARSRVRDLGGTSGEHAAVSSRPVDDGQRRQELRAGDRGEPDARARRVLRVVAGEGRPRRR